MEQLTLITVSAVMGLLISVLLAQVLNHIRIIKTVQRIQTLEDRILARLLVLTKQLTPEPMGTPVTMEDLDQIQMELELSDKTPQKNMPIKGYTK